MPDERQDDMGDETNDEPHAKVTSPRETGPDPNLTVDHDAFLSKSTAGASSPETVWKFEDGTEVRPADLVDPFAEPEA